MDRFTPFALERWMSLHEQAVAYNLSESGVKPLTLEELLGYDPAARDRFLAAELNYPQVNGIPELRSHIAGLYSGATENNVLVTVGAIEANYITVRTLCSPGDEIAVMVPNYMQIWGVGKNHDLKLKTFHLMEDRGWCLDQNELEEAVSPRTRLIAVCNPNNPTGHILSGDEMEHIVSLAERCGAWILADEVYAGAERITDTQTPSFFGRAERVAAVGSMSKAYGLPGLRLGWIVAPEAMIDEIWARHDYVAISATMLSNRLAALALSPQVRSRILDRTRGFIRRGFQVLERWVDDQDGVLTMIPPQAAAIALLRYHLPIESAALSDRLRIEQGVLVVPGDHFAVDHHLRFSFGLPENHLREALLRCSSTIMDLKT